MSVGELHHLSSHLNKGKCGKTWDWKCSCGSNFDNCAFWSKVLCSLKEKGLYDINQTHVVKNNGLKFSSQMSSINIYQNKGTIKTVDNIYESIFKVTGKSFIVDSSKNEIQLAYTYD